MTTATIIGVWEEDNVLTASVWVDEGGSLGRVEYTATVDLADLARFLGKTIPQLTNAEKRAAMISALKAVRNASRKSRTTPAITGTVDL